MNLIGKLDGDPGPVESLPFFLRFTIGLHDGTAGRCSDVPTAARLSALNLKELHYTLVDSDGHPFFSDSVNLYGTYGPGSLIVQPGLTVPERSNRVSVRADLVYDAFVFGADCRIASMEATAALPGDVVNVDIRSLPEGGKYERLVGSYKRRHLVLQGRNLSSIWLKEFEPGRDRKELLYHSRTLQLADDDRTRVFVPWTFTCQERPPLPLGNNTEEVGCGRSIHAASPSVYAGGENPLLRGGIAMASFALQARHHLQDTSLAPQERQSLAKNTLAPAMLLLKHVEASEWIGSDGQPTGFFLRADRPGKLDGHAGRAYMFASIDELSGMLLGLYELHETFKMMGDGASAFRIKDLVHRLGVRLSQNHYFILPYRRITEQVTVKIGGEIFWSTSTPRWTPIGLPSERQRGWNGSYPFEWFLNRSFRDITGNGYDAPSKTPVYVVENIEVSLPEAVGKFVGIIRDHFHIPSSVPVAQILSVVPDDAVLSFLRSHTSLKDWVPQDLIGTEADLFSKVIKSTTDKTGDADPLLDRGMEYLIKRNFSPSERVVYAIQGLGILAYYDATESQRYPICQHLEAQHFVPPNFCITVQAAGAGVAFLRELGNRLLGQYLWGPVDYSAVTQGISVDAKYWNIPILMHLFQAANLQADVTDPKVSAVRKEMARFIKGLLVNGGVMTGVRLDELIPEEMILADVPDIFHELVGRPDRDADYYAAALARKFNLPAEFSNAVDREAFENGIQWAIHTIEDAFAHSAPIAEPTVGFCAAETSKVCGPADCGDDVGPNTLCNSCGDNGPCSIEGWAQIMPAFQPAPFSEGDKVPFGNSFIWERRPRSSIRHMGASKTGGLVIDELHALYRRGQLDRSMRYAALNEGAGLGFVLPYAMLGKPTLKIHRETEFLPACYTNPVLEAKPAIASTEKCNYWFKRASADPFDQSGGGRNDSLAQATALTIGTSVQATIDKSTDTAYWRYAVFKSTQGQLREIPPEMDYDFYYFDNPTEEQVRITLQYLLYPRGIISRLYVDAREVLQGAITACMGPNPCFRQVSTVVNGKTRHTLMIMGDVGEYRISTERVVH